MEVPNCNTGVLRAILDKAFHSYHPSLQVKSGIVISIYPMTASFQIISDVETLLYNLSINQLKLRILLSI
jgi:hypothetical protein